MATIKLLVTFTVVCSLSVDSIAISDDKYEALVQRFAELEAREEARKTEMQDMKNKMEAMETEFSLKMADLEMMSLENGDSGKEDTRRAVSQTPIAFYSYITKHDINNLQAGQRLIFDGVHTNVGNAYYNHSGLFVAPLAGTYVISATVTGPLNNVTTSYFTVNVNNDVRAKLLCGTLQQDTNTLVLQLSAGDSVHVAVPAQRQNGVLGIYYSTFSGFLLYEN